MQKNDYEEILPVIDGAGNIIGSASRSECHSGSMMLHPVVHLHILSKDNKILLQKRSKAKQIQPGKWDTAVGGHIGLGESVEMVLKREALEEVGLSTFAADRIAVYENKTDAERELVYTHVTHVDEGYIPIVEYGESDELRFWDIEEIDRFIGSGIFTPNFEYEFATYLKNYPK